MRLVLDSNVIVAAFAVRGLCAALFEYCIESHEVFICEEMLKEVRRVLGKRIKVPGPIADEIDKYLRDSTEIVRPARVARNACRDKKDLPVLGTAVASVAALVISGDDDLLSLKEFEGIEILTPREFWQRMKT